MNPRILSRLFRARNRNRIPGARIKTITSTITSTSTTKNREAARRGILFIRPLRAFTLIELLIVVAIVAILAAIGAVNYREAMDRADRVACASSLKAILPALWAYRVDWNHYPLADGVAGAEPSMGRTEPGNGPAANGSWDGVPRVLVTTHYLSGDQALFCPVLAKRHPNRKQWLRYAYNASAADTGGFSGAPNHLDRDSHEIWIARCLWVPYERSFTPSQKIEYPHGAERQQENVLLNSGAVVLRDGREEYRQTYSISQASQR